MSGGGFLIAGPAGRIEALLREPEQAPRFAAVVCHPHPLYGGTMHNKVVHGVAKRLLAAGGVTVRFQFRGVGLSEGRHDRGIGELDDLAAVITWLTAHAPNLPLLSCGYSFGAWVALRGGAVDRRVHGMLGVGLATTVHDFTDVATSTKPKGIVQGDRDALGPATAVAELAERWVPPTRLFWVLRADHFFTDATDGLARQADDAAAYLLAGKV